MNELVQKQRNEVASPEPMSNGTTFTPRFDIYETDAELLLYGDLPGVTSEGLEIRYENRELTIHGKVEPRSFGSRSLYGEYDVGDFHRVFRIPEILDAEKIHAELKHGVLTIHLPKVQAVTPRKIPVTG